MLEPSNYIIYDSLISCRGGDCRGGDHQQDRNIVSRGGGYIVTCACANVSHASLTMSKSEDCGMGECPRLTHTHIHTNTQTHTHTHTQPPGHQLSCLGRSWGPGGTEGPPPLSEGCTADVRLFAPCILEVKFPGCKREQARLIKGVSAWGGWAVLVPFRPN